MHGMMVEGTKSLLTAQHWTAKFCAVHRIIMAKAFNTHRGNVGDIRGPVISKMPRISNKV